MVSFRTGASQRSHRSSGGAAIPISLTRVAHIRRAITFKNDIHGPSNAMFDQQLGRSKPLFISQMIGDTLPRLYLWARNLPGFTQSGTLLPRAVLPVLTYPSPTIQS
jgi:hypothetical protein